MPDWKTVIRERIAALRLAPAEEADLAEELAQHLEDRYRELRSGGTGAQEAYEQVAGELQDLEALRRKPVPEPVPAGSMRSGNLLEDLWKDLRYAGRTMRTNPLFVLFVVLTLGLGIGANTTVFTLINTLLLHPVPVPNASRLAAVAGAESKMSAKSRAPLPISYLNLKDYQARNEVFRSLAGYTSARVITVRLGGASERMFAELVTGNYFSTLGLKPAAGRFFLAEEDGAPGAHAVAVMNYGTWQSRFGGADVIGQTLGINNLAFTVIGVAPPKFIGLNAIFGPDFWIPAAMAEQLLPTEMREVLGRGKAVFLGAGELKPGISRAQAQANIATIAAALAREYPEVNQGYTAAVHPITDVLFGSAGSGSSPIVFAGAVLLIVVAIVLLIACSNAANLLLARSTARQHEMAIRLAMGASRGRLVRQLLTESVWLGLLSGLAGLWIGYAGVKALWRFLPSGGGANFITPRLDPAVLVFTLIVSVLTGLAFGTIPALRTSRIELSEALQQEARTIGRSRRRIAVANVLLVGQVAFSFLLLVMAGLFLRSIGRAYRIDPGFQTEHLAVFLTNPGQAGYSQTRTKAFYKEVRERVAALPGIESAAWASNLPLWGRVANGLQVEGREQRSRSDTITTILNTVDPDYFATAGVALDKGREFTETDREDSTPVAIVNEKLAHDYWPDQEALGKRIQLPNEKKMRQIVGVARTANYSTLAEPPQNCVYVPLEQNYSDAMTLYVRTKADPRQILMAVQREVQAAGPEILIKDLRTGRQIIDNGLFQAKVGVTLLSVFGLVALGLASVGLYGIMAYAVNQRTREIGARMALGAAQFRVVRMILRQGMSLVVTGVLIGFAASLAAGSLLSRMLYGVSAGDPISVAGAASILLGVALVACYLPARRASRLDPLAALREG